MSFKHPAPDIAVVYLKSKEGYIRLRMDVSEGFAHDYTFYCTHRGDKYKM